MQRKIGSTLVVLGIVVVLLAGGGCGVQRTEIIASPGPPQSPPNTSPTPVEQDAVTGSAAKPSETTPKSVSPPQKERILFDGKSLEGWKASVFGGDGEIKLSNDSLSLGMGDPLTGVSYSGSDLPRNHYEVSLEARRVSGNDFFCCLTFPVDDSHCSLVVGGWAGSIVGLSCLDEKDAARNETIAQWALPMGSGTRFVCK